MALHGDLDADIGIHKIYAFKYSNEANRLADSRAAGPKDAAGNYRPLVDGEGGDIGKVAYQSDTSKYYTLTGIGTPGGGYGSQGTLTWAPFASEGAGTGDMSGPGSSVSGNVVSWNNTAGTLTADSGKVAADLVTGPASATDTAIVLMDGTTGRLIKESVVTVNGSGDITTAGTVDGRDISADGAALDGHIASTSNPHSTDIANLGTGTKAELVGRLTDATVLLSNVSEDTSPTLGGDLDVGSYDIVSTGGASIEIKPNGAGDVLLGDSTQTGIVTCGRVALGTTNTITSSASMTMDCKAANTFFLTLDHVGATLSITGSSLVSGSTGILWITQGTGGSKTITTWPTEFKWGTDGVPTLSTAEGKIDLLTWTTNGTVCLVSVKPDAGA